MKNKCGDTNWPGFYQGSPLSRNTSSSGCYYTYYMYNNNHIYYTYNMYDRICRLMAKKKTPTHTFTMPEADFALIGKIQSKCRKHDLTLNDCEVVRAGLHALMQIQDKPFLQAVKSVDKLKRGKSEEEAD